MRQNQESQGYQVHRLLPGPPDAAEHDALSKPAIDPSKPLKFNALHSVYVEAFCAPPCNEDEEQTISSAVG
ncbi:hypothetical protein [Streptomyces sp. NPDC046727]|uniref:hypothetical protein n=1 Tax=Streptomyces sp. NPDC046727 TaxID=3155373 RepID=UPI0033FAFFEE